MDFGKLSVLMSTISSCTDCAVCIFAHI